MREKHAEPLDLGQVKPGGGEGERDHRGRNADRGYLSLGFLQAKLEEA